MSETNRQRFFALVCGLAVALSVLTFAARADVVANDTVATRTSRQTIPFGVPLAAPIYFVNFMFLYFLNPPTAAQMPAYRAPIPQQVYKCLLDNPDGCPYEQVARFFRDQAADKRDLNTDYPSDCQTTAPWQSLAPPVFQDAGQINEPLGDDAAKQLAHALGITDDMILSRSEYSCVVGVPPRTQAQNTLYACFIDFTASNGNMVVVPFSSYGLNLNEQGKVLSLCAPSAPCLEANKVFLLIGEIADRCGFRNKLELFLSQTQVFQFIEDGHKCQKLTAPACIAETTCTNGPGQAGCAPASIGK
jgi:hypothetical protein